MKRIAVYPYKMGSKSVKGIVTKLGNVLRKKGFKVKGDSRLFQPKKKVILNWGNGSAPLWAAFEYLNSPKAVAVAQNKLSTFEVLNGVVPIPEWTTDREVALDWNAKTTIIARHILNGHSGHGITVHDKGVGDIGHAPLYVKYKKKKKEFRVHVFCGEVIDVQEKRREREVERDDDQQKIRNRANGWIFAREDIVEPQGLREIALAAVDKLALDFGAVDIIWNEKENQCYVLEVNTAPGLEGTTLENYTNAIIKYLQG